MLCVCLFVVTLVGSYAFTSMTISCWSIALSCDKNLHFSSSFFILFTASQRETQYTRNLGDESMAKCKIASNGRLGWGWFPFSWFAALWGTSGGYYNIRSWSNEIWNVGEIGGGSGIWLGVLWESSTHSLQC